MDIVVTDFGNVRLSDRTLAWLNIVDSDWRTISTNKRKRSKHALNVRQQVQRLEDAVMIAAAIAWHAGDELLEF
jgi:hypothetical protein